MFSYLGGEWKNLNDRGPLKGISGKGEILRESLGRAR